MNSLMHLHLFAAIAWIGGSIFMFILGVTLSDKKKQKEVYPHVGPIFGYYELASLFLLLGTGISLIWANGLLDVVFTDDTSEVVHFLRMKLWIVGAVIVATAVHFFIALKTNDIPRTDIENFISRGSSLFIFFANLFILHYAIMIRSILQCNSLKGNSIQEHNIASAWFNDFYHKHKNNHENIPWARQAVNPLLESYLNDKNITHKGIALVIGCGLGDDAYALFLAGYKVVAIDVSQTALDLASTRFKDACIDFELQDIFDMPDKYKNSFDFVFEAFTIQSLPVKFRERMIDAISKTLKKDAKLLVIANKREHDFEGPPWPLLQVEVDIFKRKNLKEISFEILQEKSHISNSRFRILYQKNQLHEAISSLIGL